MNEHKRYFIYQVNPDGKIRYREATGNWVEDFKFANLWSNEAFAIKKAKELKKSEQRWERYNGKQTWRIGTVDIQPGEFNWKEV